MAEGVERRRPSLFGIVAGVCLCALGLFLLAITSIAGSVFVAVCDGLAGLLALGAGVALVRGKT